MVTWLVIAAYLFGWVASVRPALRRWMLAEACIACRRLEPCPADKGRKHGQRAPRGAISDRNGFDAAGVVWLTMWWPFRLLGLLIALVVRTTGRGISAAVLGGRLTEPELERRAQRIAQLTKEVLEP